ncbi:MAG: SMP-30/gluconolactonase/LRE family protein [Opitutales bacterium]|nr:SMP-30/gluconolactonase/LRE family protein [Opitutales bacterium]
MSTILSHQQFYTEGPVHDTEGTLYFTNLKGGQIIRRDRNGYESVWARTACPNGQRITPNGDHLVCDSQLGAVIRFDAEGRWVAVAAEGNCQNIRIRTPNDLALDGEGGFFFTDSVRHCGAVYHYPKHGRGVVVARDLDYPNGICLSADKRRLFVAESYRNRILVFDLNEQGSFCSKGAVFCELPEHPENKLTGNLPDGITLDSKGQLWVAHYGMQAVHRIDANGNLLESFDTGIPLTSNLSFNSDETELVVTGGTTESGPGFVATLNMSKQLTQ